MQFPDEAKQAYEIYQHRAGTPDHTPFERLSVLEQQGWDEVVAWVLSEPIGGDF